MSLTQFTDVTASQVDRPTRIGKSLPSTCKRGELFFLVGTVNQLYASLSTNVWTAIAVQDPNNVPATSTSTGTAGQMAYDGAFIYICIATNTWLRAPLSDWP